MKYGWRYSLSHGWYGKGILGEQFESQHPKQQEILILRIVKDDPPKGASRFSHCPRNGKLLEWILKSNQKWPLKKNQTELTIIWLGKVWDTPTRLNPMTHSLQSNSEAWLAWVESSTFRSVWWNNACLCDVTLKKNTTSSPYVAKTNDIEGHMLYVQFCVCGFLSKLDDTDLKELWYEGMVAL